MRIALRLSVVLLLVTPARTAAARFVVSSEALEQAVRDFVIEQSGAGADVRLTFPRLPERVVVEKPVEVLKVLPGPAGPLRRTTVVFVGVFYRGALIKRIPVTVQVKVVKRVLVATGMIERFAMLAPGDFRSEEVDITALPGKPISSTDALTGLRARRVISAGRVLLYSMIERPPVIRRGDRVTILVRIGAVRAAALGIAKADGRTGDRIRVKNADSGKELVATVRDANTVIVETGKRRTP